MSNNNPRVPPIGGPSPSFYQQNKGDIWSLIGAGVTWGKDAWQNKKNRQLEEARRKYDQAQWERQNRYNHPIEQMKRLKDAGLNPNMIYGSSPGSAVGNAGAIPAGQAPEYSLTNPVTGYMSTKVQQAQTKNLQADVLLKATQGMKNTAEAGLTGSRRALLDAQADDLISQTGSNATISKINALIKSGTKESVIKQAMTKLNGMELANKLQAGALQWVEAGMHGSAITQIAMALGDDLRTPEGVASFRIKANIAIGLKGAESVSNIVRNILTPWLGSFISRKPSVRPQKTPNYPWTKNINSNK